MTTEEFNLRLIVIDNSIVLQLIEGKQPQILESKRAKQALRFLGLDTETIPVPERSYELAETEEPALKVTGVSLELLSVLAEYKDPLRQSQIKQLTTINPSTISSKLSTLKTHGFIIATGHPFNYMVSPKGHAALVARSTKDKTDG